LKPVSGAALLLGQGIAHLAVGHRLDAGGEKPDLARPERRQVGHFGGEDADPVDLVGRPGRHHADLQARLQLAVVDSDQSDHPEIGVVPGIDQERLERRVAIAHRWR
jgi:hypothetical protein